MKLLLSILRKSLAALLQEDGVVVKKKGENYSIGDVVIMNEGTIKRRGKLRFATVAALFLVLIGAGTVAYASPYYYVSMDVNPSIVMKVNAFNRVIGIEAVNDDAVAIVQQLEVKNKRVDDAVCSAVAQLEQAGYLY
jgi:transcription antitermination factor NusG